MSSINMPSNSVFSTPTAAATYTVNNVPYIITSSGIGGLTTCQLTPAMQAPAMQVTGDTIFDGDARVNGNLIVNSKKLDQVLDKISERLNLLHLNPALEEKWDELKEIGDKYRALEKEITEKEKLWSMLNK